MHRESGSTTVSINCISNLLRVYCFTNFVILFLIVSFFGCQTLHGSAKSLEEKELFCSSIIRTLEIEGDLCMSTATARASIFLAEVLTEARRHEDAIVEVTKTIGRLTSSSSESANASHTTLLARAYRVLADVYEQTGNYRGAMESILSMASCNPSMRTKVSKEIDRLRLLAAQQSSS